MDQLDQKIIAIMQEQGRISLTELGKLVGLSQPAVTERVRRLEEKEIISQYRAVVPAQKINKTMTAFLLFHTKNCEGLVEFCKQADDLMECHRISGQYNYLLKVVTESMQSLEAFINECGKFGDSTTMIVMSTPIDYKPLIPLLAE
jgi:Lrp/AsnC family leucine-responsive transcriptional regulator